MNIAENYKSVINRVVRAAVELEWEPRHSDAGTVDFDRDGNPVGEVVTRTCFEFDNWTSGGQAFTAVAYMEGDDIGSLLDSLDEEAEGFDADEEARLYIMEDMLGRNGVPHDIRGLLDDMEERGDMLLNFAKDMRELLS